MLLAGVSGVNCGPGLVSYVVTEPILTPSQGMEPLPQTWQKFFENVGQVMAHIKTYDQTTYETRIDGERIEIKI